MATGPADSAAALVSARRSQGLTDDLLLARLEGPGAAPAEPVDLAAIVEEQVAERQHATRSRVAFTMTRTGPAVVAGDGSSWIG